MRGRKEVHNGAAGRGGDRGGPGWNYPAGVNGAAWRSERIRPSDSRGSRRNAGGSTVAVSPEWWGYRRVIVAVSGASFIAGIVIVLAECVR